MGGLDQTGWCILLSPRLGQVAATFATSLLWMQVATSCATRRALPGQPMFKYAGRMIFFSHSPTKTARWRTCLFTLKSKATLYPRTLAIWEPASLVTAAPQEICSGMCPSLEKIFGNMVGLLERMGRSLRREVATNIIRIWLLLSAMALRRGESTQESSFSPKTEYHTFPKAFATTVTRTPVSSWQWTRTVRRCGLSTHSLIRQPWPWSDERKCAFLFCIRPGSFLQPIVRPIDIHFAFGIECVVYFTW